MSSAMEVILLERVDSLGQMGEVVRVRPGFARNYLLPQKKALRATKDNIAYFETQRAALEKINAEKKKEAEKVAKKLEGLKVSLIRLAAEGGQLFGSVNSRDIADAISAQSKIEVSRTQVPVNQAIKTIGLFPVTVVLHPEVKVEIQLNIARSEEEAKIQAETGRALIASAGNQAPAAASADDEAAKASLLEDSALEAEKQWDAEAQEKAGAKAEKAAKRAAKKSPKKDDTAEDDAE